MRAEETSLTTSGDVPFLGDMRTVYRTSWHIGQTVLRVYFRFRVFHRERVPRTGPLIIAANHESFLDPVLVGGAIPREVHFLARESALRSPGWGRLLRYYNAIPIKLDGGSLAGMRAGLDVLEAGKALVVFPEGTRTADGNVRAFRSGIGLLAAKSRTPILPVRVSGMYQAYGRHRRWPRPLPVTVRIGNLLTWDRQRAELSFASKTRLKEIYGEIADETREAVIRS